MSCPTFDSISLSRKYMIGLDSSAIPIRYLLSTPRVADRANRVDEDSLSKVSKMKKKRKALVSRLRLAEVVQLALEALLSGLDEYRVMSRVVAGDQGVKRSKRSKWVKSVSVGSL